MPPLEKTESQSFRVDRRIMTILREESKRKNISLSGLVNQILTTFADYGRFADRMNALSLARKTFTSILNSVSDEDVARAAEIEGKSSPIAYITSMSGDITPDRVVDFIDDLSKHAHLFEYSIESESPPTYTLVHELGSKWSIFLAHYLGEAFKSAGAQVKFTISDRAVTFSL